MAKLLEIFFGLIAQRIPRDIASAATIEFTQRKYPLRS